LDVCAEFAHTHRYEPDEWDTEVSLPLNKHALAQKTPAAKSTPRIRMKLKRLLPIVFLVLFSLLASTTLMAQVHKSAHRVVFALTSGDQLDWRMTTGNISNLLTAMDSTDVEVEVVAYGPGVAFLKKGSAAEADIKELEQKHVHFVACQNSMHFQHLTPADLIEGVGVVPSGVTEVILKQEQGWSYIKAGR
jgi:intracellular sulfur oxidation DsrE/DsrF family protein